MRRLALLVPLLLAITLLWLGLPRGIASVLTAPAHKTVWRLDHGETPTPVQLELAAGYLETATGWELSARLFRELGSLRLQQALATEPKDPKMGALANQSAIALRAAVLLSPARPHPWLKLAYARALEGAEPSEVAHLLTQSARIGPFVGEIAIPRLDLLLRAWDHLSPEMQSYTAEHVRFVWANAQHELLQLVRSTPRPGIIRFALRFLPEAVERIDAVIARRAN